MDLVTKVSSHSSPNGKLFLWEKSKVDELLSLLSLVPGTTEHSSLTSQSNSFTDDAAVHCSDVTESGRDVPVQCGVCHVTLVNRPHQVQHYATDFHKYNQSRVLRGLLPYSIYQFDRKVADGSSSSSSSAYTESDDEAEEDYLNSDQAQCVITSPAHKSLLETPRLFLHNTAQDCVFSLCRVLLLTKKVMPQSAESLLSAAERLPQSLRWTILMDSGGHFAGAVFAGERALAHKTFHSYTVRAGQGGSQGAHDSRSGSSHSKSAGASLRRYNERSHAQHIQEILEDWRELIRDSHLVFVRASSCNQATIFSSGGKTPLLNRGDSRLRKIPFSTRRPTYSELKRVHKKLSEVVLHGTLNEFQTEFLGQGASESELLDSCCPDTDSSEQSTPSSRSSSEEKRAETVQCVSPEPSFQAASAQSSSFSEGTTFKKAKKKTRIVRDSGSVAEGLLMETSLQSVKEALYSACYEGLLPQLQALQSFFKRECDTLAGMSQVTVESLKRYRDQVSLFHLTLGDLDKTPLHVATEKGHKDVVSWLLSTGECDLTAKDKRNRVPYSCSPGKTMKLVYRNFREQQPLAYNYTKSLIPPPLDAADKEAATELKLTKKAARKLKEKENRLKKQELLREQKEREHFLELSDREKRALAAERRLLASCSPSARPVLLRCFQCGEDISGAVPYEYSDNKFCSTACVRLHREKHRQNTKQLLHQ